MVDAWASWGAALLCLDIVALARPRRAFFGRGWRVLAHGRSPGG